MTDPQVLALKAFHEAMYLATYHLSHTSERILEPLTATWRMRGKTSIKKWLFNIAPSIRMLANGIDSLCKIIKPIHLWFIESDNEAWITWSKSTEYRDCNTPLREILSEFNRVTSTTTVPQLNGWSDDSSYHAIALEHTRRFLRVVLDTACPLVLKSLQDFMIPSQLDLLRNSQRRAQEEWLKNLFAGEPSTDRTKLDEFASLLMPHDLKSNDLSFSWLLLRELLSGKPSILLPAEEYTRLLAELKREMRLMESAATGLPGDGRREKDVESSIGIKNPKSPPVQLSEPSDPVFVLGKEKPRLTQSRYKVIYVLCERFPGRIKLDVLRKKCNTESPNQTLRAIAELDDDWASVISFPGDEGYGEGYGLVYPKDSPQVPT